jgi:hypothetical protein
MKTFTNHIVLFIFALALGACLGCVKIVWDQSCWGMYEKLRTGTPKREVGKMLNNAGLRCGAEIWQDPITECAFSDAWQLYTITFDRDTGIVKEKRFQYRSFPLFTNRELR